VTGLKKFFEYYQEKGIDALCPAVGAAPLKAGQAKINSDKLGTGFNPAAKDI
jgi:hypothetical protein